MNRSVLLPTTMMCGLVFGLFSSAVVTYVMPRKYESSVVIQIARQPEQGAVQQALTDREIATECRVITSRKVLDRVVDSTGLIHDWNLDPETCHQVLGTILQVNRIKGANLISIRCRHTNSVSARDIANGVADAYRQYRLDIENSENERILMELRKAVQEEEDKLEEKRAILTTLIKNRQGTAAPESDNSSLKDLDHVDAKRDYETQMELLQQMKLKLVSETITRKARSPEVNIHSPAVVADRPISPNITLNLALGCAAGLSAGIFLGLVLMPLVKADGR